MKLKSIPSRLVLVASFLALPPAFGALLTPESTDLDLDGLFSHPSSSTATQQAKLLSTVLAPSATPGSVLNCLAAVVDLEVDPSPAASSRLLHTSRASKTWYLFNTAARPCFRLAAAPTPGGFVANEWIRLKGYSFALVTTINAPSTGVLSYTLGGISTRANLTDAIDLIETWSAVASPKLTWSQKWVGHLGRLFTTSVTDEATRNSYELSILATAL